MIACFIFLHILISVRIWLMPALFCQNSVKLTENFQKWQNLIRPLFLITESLFDNLFPISFVRDINAKSLYFILFLSSSIIQRLRYEIRYPW